MKKRQSLILGFLMILIPFLLFIGKNRNDANFETVNFFNLEFFNNYYFKLFIIVLILLCVIFYFFNNFNFMAFNAAIHNEKKEIKVKLNSAFILIIAFGFIFYLPKLREKFLFLSILFIIGLSIPLINLLRIVYVAYKKNCEKEQYHPNGLFTGIHNGEIYTVHLKDGERNGEYKEFFLSGSVKCSTKFLNGIQLGKTIRFFENGNIYREFQINNGEYFGEIKEYFETGPLKFTNNENNYVFYGRNGEKRCEINLDFNGYQKSPHGYDKITSHRLKPMGKWTNINKDGLIEYELLFKDNALLGEDSKYSNEYKATKIQYSKEGSIVSEGVVKFNFIEGFQINFLNDFAEDRFMSWIFSYNPFSNSGIKINLSGTRSLTKIKLKPIESLEDIIHFI